MNNFLNILSAIFATSIAVINSSDGLVHFVCKRIINKRFSNDKKLKQFKRWGSFTFGLITFVLLLIFNIIQLEVNNVICWVLTHKYIVIPILVFVALAPTGVQLLAYINKCKVKKVSNINRSKYYLKTKYNLICNILGMLCNTAILFVDCSVPGFFDFLKSIPSLNNLLVSVIVICAFYSIDVCCQALDTNKNASCKNHEDFCDTVYNVVDSLHLFVTFSFIAMSIIVILLNYIKNYISVDLDELIFLVITVIMLVLFGIFMFWTSKSKMAKNVKSITESNIVWFPIVSILSSPIIAGYINNQQLLFWFITAILFINAIYILSWLKNEKIIKTNEKN